MVVMFLALVMWLGVLIMEGLAKSFIDKDNNFIDPVSIVGSRIGIAVEEGLEMFGATLFLFGFKWPAPLPDREWGKDPTPSL